MYGEVTASIKRLCLAVPFYLLAACTSAPGIKGVAYTDFPRSEKLQATTIPLDTVVFRYPFRIAMQGDRAAVLDLHGADHFVQVFTYPEFRHIAACGKRGEAPGEMLSAENLRWNHASLQVLDANKSELTTWQLADGADSLTRIGRIKLDKAVLRALDFVQTDDSTFLIPDYSGNHRFCRVNLNGKLVQKIGTIPVTDEETFRNVRPALAQAWRSFIDYNPRNGILAAATQLGEVLEVWNLQTGTHVVRTGPGGAPKFQNVEGYGIPTGIMGFSSVQVGDSAIYAVFQGQSFKDIAQSARRGKNLPDGGKNLYVFSLTGEPLVKYELDHYIHGIYVNEKEKFFIATDVNMDEPMLRYKL